MSVLSKAKGKIERITVDWAHIDASEVQAGTPFGADGQIHNDGDARGLLMSTINEPWSGTAEIITAGYVDKVEAETLSGIELTNEAQCAMHDIHFSGTGGKVDSMVAVAG